MAEHVVDGWNALQFPGQIPRVELSMSFELTTATSCQAYTTLIEATFQAGKPLHEYLRCIHQLVPEPRLKCCMECKMKGHI